MLVHLVCWLLRCLPGHSEGLHLPLRGPAELQLRQPSLASGTPEVSQQTQRDRRMAALMQGLSQDSPDPQDAHHLPIHPPHSVHQAQLGFLNRTAMASQQQPSSIDAVRASEPVSVPLSVVTIAC